MPMALATTRKLPRYCVPRSPETMAATELHGARLFHIWCDQVPRYRGGACLHQPTRISSLVTLSSSAFLLIGNKSRHVEQRVQREECGCKSLHPAAETPPPCKPPCGRPTKHGLLDHPNNTLINLAQTASLKQPAHAYKFHKPLLRGAFLPLPEYLACLGT